MDVSPGKLIGLLQLGWADIWGNDIVLFLWEFLQLDHSLKLWQMVGCRCQVYVDFHLWKVQGMRCYHRGVGFGKFLCGSWCLRPNWVKEGALLYLKVVLEYFYRALSCNCKVLWLHSTEVRDGRIAASVKWLIFIDTCLGVLKRWFVVKSGPGGIRRHISPRCFIFVRVHLDPAWVWIRSRL